MPAAPKNRLTGSTSVWPDDHARLARKMRLEGRTYEQIAKALNKTRNAVSGHFQRNPVDKPLRVRGVEAPPAVSEPENPAAARPEPLKLRTFSWET